MKQSQFKKGIIYACAGSLWWGLLGTIFFKYISYMGAIEVTILRLIWTDFGAKFPVPNNRIYFMGTGLKFDCESLLHEAAYILGSTLACS